MKPFQISVAAIATIFLLLPVDTLAQQDPPASLHPQIQLAEQLKDQSRWEEALTVLREVVAQREQDEAAAALAQVRIGQYFVSMALPAEAESELRKAGSEFPGFPEYVGVARVHLIDALAFQGQTAQAVEAARGLAQDDAMLAHHRAWGRVKLVGLLREQGKMDQAITELEALDAVPWSPETAVLKAQAGLTHGEILVAKSMYPSAASVLRNVIANASGVAPSTVNWARVRLLEALTHSHHLVEVETITQQVISDHGAALASDDQVAWALVWQGRALKKFSQFEAAIAPLQMAAATADQTHPGIAYEAEFELGEVYRLWGDTAEDGGTLHEEALGYYHAAYQRAIDADLSERLRDQALLQVGSEMRHLGMRDRGIAWLRRGIEDPANLTDSDKLLLRRIDSFLSTSECESWQAYVMDPAAESDPTAGLVWDEFGVGPAAPSSTVVNRPFERRYWSAKLSLRQRHYNDAATALQAALPLAQTPAHRGEALTNLAHCHRRLGNQAEMLPTANQAAAAWMEALESAERPGDAHYAIDMVRSSYDIVGRDDLVIEALEGIVGALDPDQQASRVCFARFLLMREYATAGRTADAATLGEEILQQYLGRPFEGAHDWLCAHTILELASLYTRTGQVAAAQSWLNWIEFYWPGQYATELSVQRAHIQATISSSD